MTTLRRDRAPDHPLLILHKWTDKLWINFHDLHITQVTDSDGLAQWTSLILMLLLHVVFDVVVCKIVNIHLKASGILFTS